MKEINAVQLRQSLSRLVRDLERNGDPVILRLGRRRVGAIVSLRDFHERFVLKVAEEERKRLVDEILADRRPGAVPVQKVLDELRGR
jgi:hypothetical protein